MCRPTSAAMSWSQLLSTQNSNCPPRLVEYFFLSLFLSSVWQQQTATRSGDICRRSAPIRLLPSPFSSSVTNGCCKSDEWLPTECSHLATYRHYGIFNYNG
ncbi:hypothetical protein CDAR_603231 [Caerostris darwini]|uniref:Uncharacterized protein n=1 Tax=Caerostris darwini TaxID=1538125 RepID=A0AAV4PIQ4_9ARAC|nr:hypothetical protein CDAR_603231 [Caerostris darwini]